MCGFNEKQVLYVLKRSFIGSWTPDHEERSSSLTAVELPLGYLPASRDAEVTVVSD